MPSYARSSGDDTLTVREFARLPDDELRRELVRGHVVREPPAGAGHGGLALEVGWRLAAFVRRHDLGRVFAAETGFVLSEDPPTVRAPDAAFVAAARLPPDGLPSGFLRFAPDLAVEAASPSNTASQLQEKVLDFLDAGTRLVWVVDPETRTVTEYLPREAVRVLDVDDELDGGEVLPGFGVPVAALFAV